MSSPSPPFSSSSSSSSSFRAEETGAAIDREPDRGVLLYTPEQAAALLQVPESWLRRRAAARGVPWSFLGKHLRFSRADLDAIVAAAGVSPADRLEGVHGRPRRHRLGSG